MGYEFKGLSSVIQNNGTSVDVLSLLVSNKKYEDSRSIETCYVRNKDKHWIYILLKGLYIITQSGTLITNAKRLIAKSYQQKAWLWLADAKTSKYHPNKKNQEVAESVSYSCRQQPIFYNLLSSINPFNRKHQDYVYGKWEYSSTRQK